MDGRCPDHPCLECGFYAWHWISCLDGRPNPTSFYCGACATPAPGTPDRMRLVAQYMTGLRSEQLVRI